MYLIHHYLQKGFTMEYLLNISMEEKHFMMASMSKHLEEERDKQETV